MNRNPRCNNMVVRLCVTVFFLSVFSMEKSIAAPDISLSRALVQKTDVVSSAISAKDNESVTIGVQYSQPATDTRKVTTVQFTITYDATQLTPGTPVKGLELGQKHTYYFSNANIGNIVVIVSPVLGTDTIIPNGEILRIPFILKGSIPLNQPLVNTSLLLTNVAMSDGAIIPNGSMTNATISIAWIDTDDDGVPDSQDHFPNNPDISQDTDNDGIANAYDGDDDNDGIPDDYEIANGLDPLADDTNADFDGDGLSNLKEYQLGTSANNDDSDGDKLPDGWEVRYGLNPISNDSDNDGELDDVDDQEPDGLSNYQEYLNNTHPFNSDTDNDGVTDGDEIAAGTDPNVNIPAIMSIIQNLLLN